MVVSFAKTFSTAIPPSKQGIRQAANSRLSPPISPTTSALPLSSPDAPSKLPTPRQEGAREGSGGGAGGGTNGRAALLTCGGRPPFFNENMSQRLASAADFLNISSYPEKGANRGRRGRWRLVGEEGGGQNRKQASTPERQRWG